MTAPDDRLLEQLTVAELRALIRAEVESAVKAALEARVGPPKPPKTVEAKRPPPSPEAFASVLAWRRRHEARRKAKGR